MVSDAVAGATGSIAGSAGCVSGRTGLSAVLMLPASMLAVARLVRRRQYQAAAAASNAASAAPMPHADQFVADAVSSAGVPASSVAGVAVAGTVSAAVSVSAGAGVVAGVALDDAAGPVAAVGRAEGVVAGARSTGFVALLRGAGAEAAGCVTVGCTGGAVTGCCCRGCGVCVDVVGLVDSLVWGPVWRGCDGTGSNRKPFNEGSGSFDCACTGPCAPASMASAKATENALRTVILPRFPWVDRPCTYRQMAMGKSPERSLNIAGE